MDGMISDAVLGAWGDLFNGLPATDTPAFEALCGFCEEHRDLILADLPWLAAELARGEGFPVMLAFVRRWSGTRLHISRDPAEFARKLEFDLAPRTHDRFVQRSGSAERLDVPSAWGIFLALRRVAIAIAAELCPSRGLIAQRFGVTARSLR